MKRKIALITALIFTLSLLPVFASAASIPTLTVHMTEKTGQMRHGSGGFLYGMGSHGTPNANMLTPLKPGTAVQKAPDGLQHPTGDVLDTAETFIQAGGEQVQIYLQDIYALWEYENPGDDIDDYLDKIRIMVPKIMELRESDPRFKGKFVYVPYNEPNGIWFVGIDNNTSVQAKFNDYWKRAYDLIRELDPEALIGGTSYSIYLGGAMESWIKFCVENNCEPDYVTWHELQDYCLSTFKSHLDNYRSIEKKYGMSEREIIINEYAPQDHCSVPGKLVNWIALFEENKVSGCLPYWHNAGNLDDLAADNNQPNGAWWLYKWYGDMSGDTLKVTTSTSRDKLYGLASVDDNKKSANVLLGGVDGAASVVLKDIDKEAAFAGARAVDIKVEATYWTAFHGVAPEPTKVLWGTYPVKDGSVTVELGDMEAYAAYNITITEAADEKLAGVVFKGPWRKTYEAEEALLVGGAEITDYRWTYAKSGGLRVRGIDNSSSRVDFTVSVPKGGYYRADMVYGNGYGLNTADTDINNPVTVTQTRQIDDSNKELLVLENTLRWEMEGMYTDYIYLDAGEHLISLRGTSDTPQGASLDCLTLTYAGPEVPMFDSIYEAELGDFNTLATNTTTAVTTENEAEGYSASGYITGLDKVSVEDGGGVRFSVVVPDNGLYDLSLCYNAQNDGLANIYLDNTALTLTNKLTSLPLPASTGFSEAAVSVFLQTGINIIDIDTDGAALDYIRVKKSLADKTVTVQAEDATLLGNAMIVENKFSGSGKYVAGIEGGTEDALAFTVSVPEAGEYKMVMTHSNNELFGAHTYNAQIVDRYASYSINDGEPVRLYFKNTFSNENWRTVAVPVTLREGENTIRVFNDNWRVLTCGTLKAGTSAHLPENIDYHTLVNYAPNFDSFSFTPAVTAALSGEKLYNISVSSTFGGIAVIDKAAAKAGESVTLTLKSDFAEGRTNVTANGKDVTAMIKDGELTYEVSGNTEFKVIFYPPENSDEYIVNNSFGLGDLTGWNIVEKDGIAEVTQENGTHSALLKNSLIWQRITAESGYYTLEATASGTGLIAFGTDWLDFEDPDYKAAEEFNNEHKSVTIRAKCEDGSITVTALGLEDGLVVDELKIVDFIPADENLLYFVDCGDSDTATVSEGDALGMYNSVTEQFFGPDSVTGKQWGIDDEYVQSAKYPNLLTGALTWPYEYDTQDGRSKIVSYRYAKDQPDNGKGAGVTYKFELEDGEYIFEVGFYQPAAWASVNRKGSLSVNGQVVASGILPKSDASAPVIVKKAVSVSGGYASLNLKLDSDGVGGPMISYIKISELGEEKSCVKIDTSGMEITGSATWNNQSFTVAKYAFDGDVSTFFDGVSGGYAQINFGEPKNIAKIGYIPRDNWAGRMVNTVFYASNDGQNWTRLLTVTDQPPYGEETAVDSRFFLADGKWQYLRYQNHNDYCNVAEINIYEAAEGSFENIAPDIFEILSITDKLTYRAAEDAVLMYADYDDLRLCALKTVVLKAGEGTQMLEKGHDKVFVWKKEAARPLAIINLAN